MGLSMRRSSPLNIWLYQKTADNIPTQEAKKICDRPYSHIPLKYGQKHQLVELKDTAPSHDAKKNQFTQQVMSTFLFYTRALDSTMLPMLSVISAEQGVLTMATMKKTKQFWDYAAAQNEAAFMYKVSNMLLAIYSIPHISVTQKQRAGLDTSSCPIMSNSCPTRVQCWILHVIRAVMSSTVNAKLGAFFSSMLNKWSHCKQPYKKWGIISHQQESKLITTNTVAT